MSASHVGTTPLVVRLCIDEETCFDATIVKLDSDKVVLTDCEEIQDYELGYWVRLKFEHQNGQSVSAIAQLSEIKDQAAGTCFTFRISGPGAFFRRVSGEVRHAFNRRGAYRVKPARSILTVYQVGDREVECRLLDLSATGFAVAGNPDDCCSLMRLRSAEFRIHLEPKEPPVRVWANLRNQRLVGGDVVSGLEIDLSKTEQTSFARIEAYVLKLQEESIAERY